MKKSVCFCAKPFIWNVIYHHISSSYLLGTGIMGDFFSPFNLSLSAKCFTIIMDWFSIRKKKGSEYFERILEDICIALKQLLVDCCLNTA